MYVCDVHDLVWELVGNTLDQHLAGRAKHLRVDLVEGWLTVEDDGPGIPAAEYGSRTFVEVVFTSLHKGATRDGHHPHVHVTTGVRGVGLGPVNALSVRLEVESRWDGATWRAAFERGVITEPLENVGPSSRTGTRIRLRPDPACFSESAFDAEVIGERLLELAHVFPLLSIRWQGAVLAPEHEGLVGWVRSLAEGPLAADTIISTARTIDDVLVDLAIAWDDGRASRVRSLVNATSTFGGTETRGLWHGLREVARSLGCAAPPATFDELLGPGLIAIVHVGLLDPRFGSPSRDHLRSPIAADVVKRAVVEIMEATLERSPALASFLRGRLRA